MEPDAGGRPARERRQALRDTPPGSVPGCAPQAAQALDVVGEPALTVVRTGSENVPAAASR